MENKCYLVSWEYEDHPCPDSGTSVECVYPSVVFEMKESAKKFVDKWCKDADRIKKYFREYMECDTASREKVKIKFRKWKQATEVFNSGLENMFKGNNLGTEVNGKNLREHLIIRELEFRGEK